MRRVGPVAVAAIAVFAVAFLVYLRTLLPGPSFGDWAEMQFIPAQLGIPHPTSYPLYVLLGKALVEVLHLPDPVTVARERLGASADRLLAEGEALSVEEAVALACR